MTTKTQIYKKAFELSAQFSIYYEKMNNNIKQSKGKYISLQINILIDMIATMYFDNEKFNILDMLMLIHKIDFHIRDLKNCKALSKNNVISLNKILNELYELCK